VDGAELEVPRVADLLADPAFHALHAWLGKLEVAHVQEVVDGALEQARQVALK
jgi:hypothetical protein